MKDHQLTECFATVIKTMKYGHRFYDVNQDCIVNCLNVSHQKRPLARMRLYSLTTFLNISLFIRSAKRTSFERPRVIKNPLSFRTVHLFAFEVLSGLAFAYIVDGLVFYTPGRALRSSNANILNTPSGKHLNSNASKIYKESSAFRINPLH